MAAIIKRDIRLLDRNSIDYNKWNRCVERHRGLVYNLYPYLTMLCDDWHGVIVGDYECILAVPSKRKFGFRYVPVVPFIQQLTLLGNPSSDEINAVVGIVGKLVRYGDYNISHTLSSPHGSVREKTNFSLHLDVSYRTIYANYKTSLKRALQKAHHANLSFERCRPEYVLRNYADVYDNKVSVVNTKYYSRFRKLITELEQHSQAIAYRVQQNGAVVATALFIHYNGRLYNILPCTLPQGKPCAAMHFLLDNVIRLYVGTETVLDFEGSDLPGVKQFYEQFGPVRETYFQYHINRLPFPVNRIFS
ncbi:MAG: hypothetical protein QM610_01475 [Chitinophagaceae bacterium]